jgi:hypothetical protein
MLLPVEQRNVAKVAELRAAGAEKVLRGFRLPPFQRVYVRPALA